MNKIKISTGQQYLASPKANRGNCYSYVLAPSSLSCRKVNKKIKINQRTIEVRKGCEGEGCQI